MIEILLFIINISLIGYLIYRERQHEQIVRSILAARLSRDAWEFKNTIEKPQAEEKSKTEEETEIPLEDVPAEEMLRVLNK